MATVLKYVRWDEPSLWIAAGAILFNPTFWNVVARKEYRSKTLTWLTGGRPRLACYLLAVTIFSLGIFRDYLYKEALEHQPSHEILQAGEFGILAAILFVAGNTLVLSSMYALGLTGTYLGDYFGILMEERVTGFPFNVMEHPMYSGSTMVFLATALWYAKPAGLILTGLVHIVYQVAMSFEGPFTSMIYAKRDKARIQKKA